MYSRVVFVFYLDFLVLDALNPGKDTDSLKIFSVGL